MREITLHKVAGTHDDCRVVVEDEPGQGGACHHYTVQDGKNGGRLLDLKFQNGPIQEFGLNGVTQEHLLAVVVDRLTLFQAGPFANPYNAEALEHCHAALSALLSRTRERQDRGVEGYNRP